MLIGVMGTVRWKVGDCGGDAEGWIASSMFETRSCEVNSVSIAEAVGNEHGSCGYW